MSPVPRFGLPEIDFVEVDPEMLEVAAVTKFEELQKVSLDKGDPRRKFLQAVTFVLSMVANNIDFTGKQNLLAYAENDFLDHLGVKQNVFRLEPVRAKTIIRLEVNTPESFTIPAETRVSANDLMFFFETDTVVSPGQQTIDIEAVCEEYGVIGNSYLPGQINNLVDPLPWVSSVYNITTSSGGADWESDDDYADRIRQSNSQYSTAGTPDSYKFHTRSAHPQVIDVSVTSPKEGQTLIVPLMEAGGIPTEDDLIKIREKLNDSTVRPLTDHVMVSPPTSVYYDIDATYFIPQNKLNVSQSVQEAVNRAVLNYQIWQRGKLGRGIDPSELNSMIKEAGGVRISIKDPAAYVVLTKTEIAIPSKVNITFGGYVND